jgi:hypothetical protein
MSVTLRPFTSLMVTLAAYEACRLVLVLLTGYVGMFAPSGSLHLGVAALGVVVLGLRFWALFVLPVLFAYRLALRGTPCRREDDRGNSVP